MGLSQNDRSIAGFTMGGHAMVHWFETAIPVLLIAWTVSFDVSIAVLSLIVAIGYAPFGLGALPAGILSDRVGARPLVIACLVGMSGGFLLLAVAPSIWVVGLGLLVWGVAASVYHPAGLSLISTGATDRGTVFAWHGIAGNLGLAFGPLVAAVLLVLGLEWRLVAAALALPAVAVAAIGSSLKFDPRAAGDGEAAVSPGSAPSVWSSTRTLLGGTFGLVFVIVVAEGLFYRGALTFLPTVFHDTASIAVLETLPELPGIEPPEFLYVGILLVGLTGQYAGGKLTSRIRPAPGLFALFIALVVCALAFVPAMEQGLVALLGLSILFGFVLFAIQPFYQNAVAVFTPEDARGVAYGLTYLGEFGLGAGSVAIGGYVLGAYSVATFFGVLAGFGLIGATLSIGLADAVRR